MEQQPVNLICVSAHDWNCGGDGWADGYGWMYQPRGTNSINISTFPVIYHHYYDTIWLKQIYIYIMFIIFVENVTLSIMILNNSSNMANCIANYTRIITTWFMLRLLMKLTVAKYTCTVSPLNQWTICLSLEVKLPYDPVCPSSARLMVGLSLFPLKSFTSILLSEHL